MTATEVVLAVLAVAVALLLARGSTPLVGCMLVASALAVSALLYLPTGVFVDWLGTERVARLYGWARSTPLEPPEWIHLIVFAWLGLLVWLARAELRSWLGLGLVACLGAAAELAQWLADGREPGLGDACLNVVGGMCGVVLGAAVRGLLRKRRPASERRGAGA